MSTSNQDVPNGGINTKLVNLAVVLVIACALAFLALWAIPQFTQGATETKNDVVAEVSQITADAQHAADLRSAEKLVKRHMVETAGAFAANWEYRLTEVSYEDLAANASGDEYRQWLKRYAPGSYPEILYLEVSAGMPSAEGGDRYDLSIVVFKPTEDDNWELPKP